MKQTVLVISCEHAGKDIPQEYQSLFASHKTQLDAHHACDVGALEIADYLSTSLSCDVIKTSISRLLIDCNRSLNHKKCFSALTHPLPMAEKEKIIANYYLPFREKVKNLIQNHIDNNRQVLHLSIHTFLPKVKGIMRNAAMSILYDYRRHGEKEVARIWHELLLSQPIRFRVRLNYPYQGRSNGSSFAGSLRLAFNEQDYLGLELDVNQALLEDKALFNEALKTLSLTLGELMRLL